MPRVPGCAWLVWQSADLASKTAAGTPPPHQHSNNTTSTHLRRCMARPAAHASKGFNRATHASKDPPRSQARPQSCTPFCPHTISTQQDQLSNCHQTTTQLHHPCQPVTPSWHHLVPSAHTITHQHTPNGLHNSQSPISAQDVPAQRTTTARPHAAELTSPRMHCTWLRDRRCQSHPP
jgi:hypothetical protein